MKEAFDLLNQNRVVGFATIDLTGEPSNRNFQIAHIDGTSIYFFTSNQKEVFKELQKTPVTAISVTSAESTMVRIKGPVEFITDSNAKKEILELNPGIKEIYNTSENPELELIKVSAGSGSIFRLGQVPPTYEEFGL